MINFYFIRPISSGIVAKNEQRSHDDELIELLNNASNGHEEKEAEASKSQEKETRKGKENEKEKEKSPRKPALRENLYAPSKAGDDRTESSSDEDFEDLYEPTKLKPRERTLSFETEWGAGLEDESDDSGYTDYGIIGVRLQKTIQHSKKFVIRHFFIRHAEEQSTFTPFSL